MLSILMSSGGSFIGELEITFKTKLPRTFNECEMLVPNRSIERFLILSNEGLNASQKFRPTVARFERGDEFNFISHEYQDMLNRQDLLKLMNFL